VVAGEAVAAGEVPKAAAVDVAPARPPVAPVRLAAVVQVDAVKEARLAAAGQ